MADPTPSRLVSVTRPLRVAALVKQIPEFEEMRLGEDGRLVREGLPLEMSAYCRRAVAQGVALAAASGGSCTVITLGPPSAEDVLREALAYGDAAGLPVVGVHLCDPAFAGSDTLATARALAAAVELLEAEEGQFDLVLAGRASVDADTGQVPPELAELLDRAFAAGVKRLDADADGRTVQVGCEHDDGWVDAVVALPAVLTTAERLIDPCKIKDPSVWTTVDAGRLRLIGASMLGRGPWGTEGSPTTVGEVRLETTDRAGLVLDGPIAEQVGRLLDFLDDRGVLVAGSLHADDIEPVAETAPAAADPDAPVVAVVIEPDRVRLARELLGAAARIAGAAGGRVVAIGESPLPGEELGGWGADAAVGMTGGGDGRWVEEDVAAGLTQWIEEVEPWAVIGPGTVWGREVMSRAAAAVGAGLTGDAVGLAVEDGRVIGWKPAFGGTLVAAVRARSAVQMVTVRAGVLALHAPREARAVAVDRLEVAPLGRVVVRRRRRDDDLDELARAEMVIGVGQGVDPDRYGELEPLRALLGAELAATRKVTDQGHLPHARQVGITGRSISPRLYLALGTSGKYNHTVGVRSAGTVVAVNSDPSAPLFASADVGLVAPWDEAVGELVRQLPARLDRVAGR